MSSLFAFIHLAVAAAWFGSMAYSLFVVQPRVATFLTDYARREEFLIVLAHGNRWRVVGMITVLLLSGIGV
jgi:putative copper export protein